MCIGGLCMPVGCDWVLGSDAMEDACGVCNGDGSHCHFVQMLFDEERLGNYVKIAEIPANSYRVRVEETRPSNNFIAVASKEGEFFLNGDFKQTHNGEYKFGVGVIGVYTHPESERELLVIEGPTTQALEIYEVFQEKTNPGVRISYYERTNNKAKYKPVYYWEYLEWKPCDRRCGGGSQVRSPNCVEKTAGIVSATFCNASTKPEAKTRPCNVQPCTKRWEVSSWSMCSGNDASPGEQHRKVECVKENPILEEEVVAVDDSLCTGEKPVESRECRFLEASANVSRNDADEADVSDNEDESFGAHSYERSTGTYATTGKRKLYFNKHRTRSFISSSSTKRCTTHRTTTSCRRSTTPKKCKKSTSRSTCKKTNARATGPRLVTSKYGRVFANPPHTTNVTGLPSSHTEYTTLSVLLNHQTNSVNNSTFTNTEATKSMTCSHRGISKHSTFLPLIRERTTCEMLGLSSFSAYSGSRKVGMSHPTKMAFHTTKMASHTTKMAPTKSKNEECIASIASTQNNSFLPLSHRYQQTEASSVHEILTSEVFEHDLENHRNHRKETSEKKHRPTSSRVSKRMNLHKSTTLPMTIKPGLKAIATYFPNKVKLVTFHEVVKSENVSVIKNVSLVNGLEWKRLTSETTSYTVGGHGSEICVNLHSSTSLYNIFKSKKNRQSKPSILNVIDRVQENESILRLIPSISRHGIVSQNGGEKNTETNSESALLVRSSTGEDENNIKSYHRKKKRGKN